MKEILSTDEAPGAIGPYSQAVRINGFVYTSGQLGIDPATGLMPEGVEDQTSAALKNVSAVIGAAGLDMGHVIKTTVFISDMDNFSRMNEVYKKFFSDDFPARSCVEVARLPKDALVEIEAVAAG